MAVSSPIHHIVLSGGMIYGFAFYGALRELHKKGLWKFEEIQSVYATSVGSIIATMIVLNFSWDVMDKFMVERPWHNCFKFSLHSVMNCFQNNGIFQIDTIENVLYPILSAKDISMNVTLKEFYELNHVDLHFFTVNLNEFVLVDISHTSHPDWKLTEAIYASCCAPIFFQPFRKDGVVYTDGGLLSNYPIHSLFTNNSEVKEENVLGLRTTHNDKSITKRFQESFSLYEYVFSIFARVLQRLSTSIDWNPALQIDIDTGFLPVFDLYNVVNTSDLRTSLINYGSKLVEEYTTSAEDKTVSR